jgi:hypothetical protein
MKSACLRLHLWRRWPALLALVAVLFVWPVAAQAIELAPVKTVEEDWELVVNEPDADNAAPQVTCLMSPVGDAESVYSVLEMNHASLPEFSAGGLQLQVWNGEDWLTLRDHADFTLYHSGETVTWTRQMELHAGKLNFSVINGNSDSWGTFGGTGGIKLSINSVLVSLNLYNPEISKAQSGVSFGTQRVTSLKIKRVRYYGFDGSLLHTDNTERVVHEE